MLLNCGFIGGISEQCREGGICETRSGAQRHAIRSFCPCPSNSMPTTSALIPRSAEDRYQHQHLLLLPRHDCGSALQWLMWAVHGVVPIQSEIQFPHERATCLTSHLLHFTCISPLTSYLLCSTSISATFCQPLCTRFNIVDTLATAKLCA